MSPVGGQNMNQAQKQKLLGMADIWDRFAEDRREQLTEQPVNEHFLLNEFAGQLTKGVE